MRKEARIRTSVWHTDFTDLTLQAQAVYWMLLSQPDISMAGAVPYLPGRWRHLGADPESFDVAFKELVAESYIHVDEDTSEVLVRTFVRNDGVMRSAKTRQSMWTAFRSIFSPTLRQVVLAQVEQSHVDEAIEQGWITSRDLDHARADTPSDGVSELHEDGVSGGVSDGGSLARAAAVCRPPSAVHRLPTPSTSDTSDVDDEPFELQIGDVAEDAQAQADATFNDEFWPAYPKRHGKKLGKPEALLEWRNLTVPERRRALRGAKNLAAAEQMPKDAQRFLRKTKAGTFPFDDWQTPPDPDVRGSPADRTVSTDHTPGSF